MLYGANHEVRMLPCFFFLVCLPELPNPGKRALLRLLGESIEAVFDMNCFVEAFILLIAAGIWGVGSEGNFGRRKADLPEKLGKLGSENMLFLAGARLIGRANVPASYDARLTAGFCLVFFEPNEGSRLENEKPSAWQYGAAMRVIAIAKNSDIRAIFTVPTPTNKK